MTSWRAGGIALVILGSIVALIAFGLLAGGGVLMWADRTQRDTAGYLTSPSTRLATSSLHGKPVRLRTARLLLEALANVQPTLDVGFVLTTDNAR
jgi:hypothetical protein